MRLVILCGLVGVGSIASAATLNFDFGTIITSSGTPGGPNPWVSVQLDDVTADTVRVTISHHATSAAGQYVDYLNLNVASGITTPTVNLVTNVNSSFNSLSYGTDSITDASANFDLRLDFKNAAANRINPGDVWVGDLVSSGLSVASFDELSTGGVQVPAMLHYNGFANGGSAKLAPVPEPATLLGLSAGAALLLRRKRKS
ncbi:MAG: PEP-CTERM sorting domain-containing protein [Armatimonadetes bacterium]|nr:PEP-CTERM sorting domain-containing protein [Armatimonadota bacterium]